MQVGIKPRSIREDLFRYRIRSDSMHQSLLKSQEYSLASLRMLGPGHPVALRCQAGTQKLTCVCVL